MGKRCHVARPSTLASQPAIPVESDMSTAAQHNLGNGIQIDRQPAVQPVNPIDNRGDEPALRSPRTIQDYSLRITETDSSRAAVSSIELSQGQLKEKYPRYDHKFVGSGDWSTFIRMFEISVISQQ